MRFLARAAIVGSLFSASAAYGQAAEPPKQEPSAKPNPASPGPKLPEEAPAEGTAAGADAAPTQGEAAGADESAHTGGGGQTPGGVAEGIGTGAAPRRDEPTEVRVIGSRPDLQKIPGSGYLVTEKDIARAQPFSVGEMLRRVPGVQVRDEPGGGNRLDISIRGLESGRSRRVLVLEDGIPVALNPYSEPDMYYAPPVERMRGIEVVKGSGSVLFGPQTTGGVINFLTLVPPSPSGPHRPSHSEDVPPPPRTAARPARCGPARSSG